MSSLRTRELTIVSAEGARRLCSVYFATKPPWTIAIESGVLPSTAFEGEDLFDCLVRLRLAFEGVGAKILCAGSREDVYPSGMSRQMAGGRIAYILRVAEPASDRIDIFDAATDGVVSTVEKQREYYKAWQDSILSKNL